MKSLFLILLFYFPLQADQLVFPVGTPISYHLIEQSRSDGEMFGYPNAEVCHTEYFFDLSIQEADPFLVEVTPRRIKFSAESHEEGEEAIFFDFDSQDPFLCPHPEFVDTLLDFFDIPLLFRFNSDFDVEELTGKLEDVQETLADAVDYTVPGTTLWFYQCFLTQLFHLAERDLAIGNTYPVNAFRLLEWEDEKLEDVKVREDSSYEIEEMSGTTVKGSWRGQAMITPESADHHYLLIHFHHGDVQVGAHVEWNAENALLQQRIFRANILGDYRGLLATRILFQVAQSWTAVAAESR